MNQAQMIAKLAPAIGLRAYWNAETLADNNFTPPIVAAAARCSPTNARTPMPTSSWTTADTPKTTATRTA